MMQKNVLRLEVFPGRLVFAFRICLFLAVALGLSPFVACAKGDQAASELTVVNTAGAAAEVLVDYFTSDDVVNNAAKAFVKEVHRRTGILLPIRHGSARPGNISIHIGNTDGDIALNAALAKLGQSPVNGDKPGKEGFQLVSGRVDGRGIVVVNGCDSLGTFHGIGRLLRKMRFVKGCASAPTGLDISTAPTTWQRRIIFESNAGYANTPVEGFRDIWTDYIFWGLSAISTSCDPAQQGDPRVSEFSRYQWDKWAAAVRLTQSLGLDMVHVTQVNLVAKEGEFGPANIPNFDELNYLACNANGVNPKLPRAREVLYAARKWFFEHMPYASNVDYIISGWDTGGCTDPDLGPWSIAFAEMVDSMTAPLIFKENPNAKILMRMYFVPELKALAEKMHNGWHPKSIYGFEFAWTPETDLAYLFPEQYKRVYLPMYCTDTFLYGSMGANPRPRMCESEFNYIWNDCNIRDGTGAYSEGVHEYVNHIMFLQKAWNPKLSMDEILDDICRYYFGEEAAPILKEVFLLMEPEQPEILDDPQINPRVQELVAQAEPLLPGWARSSRQWAVVVARAGIDRTRRRQADLLASFNQRWQEYESLMKPDAARPADAVDGLISYFQSIADNAWELERIYKRMQRDGFGIQGGCQIAPVWPEPRTAEAIEALGALKQLRKNAGAVAPTRWCMAFVDQDAQVCVSDGWGNYFILYPPGMAPKQVSLGLGTEEGEILGAPAPYGYAQGPQAVDAQLAIADLGSGHSEVVFLAMDGHLYRWNPLEPSAKVLAEGQFLSGPLAKGDLNGDGKDELVVLSGVSAEESSLAVVDAKGKTVVLKARPTGEPPDRAMNGIVLLEPNPLRTAKTDFDPRVRVCDVDADGKLEIAYADRDQGGKLVILDAKGQRKQEGPTAPAGVLASGDLDGDGGEELVYLDVSGTLAAWSSLTARNAALNFGERIRPKWKSSMVVASLGSDRLPEVVYADQDGNLCAIGPGRKSRRLTNVNDKTLLVGPGLVAGDFNGDGREDICCLRSHRWWEYPLATLSYVDESGEYHDLSVSSRNMQCLSYAAPLGPRAGGQMSVPIVHKLYAMEFGRRYKINWYNCGDLLPMYPLESHTVQERKKAGRPPNIP